MAAGRAANLLHCRIMSEQTTEQATPAVMPASGQAAGQQAPVEVAAARGTSDIVLKALLVLAVFYTFYFARCHRQCARSGNCACRNR
jgi:hypothetical protein